MKRIACIATLCGIWLAPALHSNAADYFVAPDGSDGNPGSRSRPFRTIQKAANVAKAGDTCWVRKGTYRESVQLNRSGAPDRPIRFQAWPGDVVVLSGVEPLEGNWSVHQGTVYKIAVPKLFDQLFVDGEMMIEARWPNMRFDQRFDKSTWSVAGKGSAYGTIVDPALAKTGIDWTGAVATLNVGSWQTWRRTVRDHQAGGDRFTYERNLTRRLESKTKWADFDRYFLSGKLEALDSSTEWHLDRRNRTLFLWAPGGTNPADRNVEYKAREFAIDAQGVEYVEIQGFHFFGATLNFEQSNNYTIDGCHLRFPTWGHGLDPAPRTSIDGHDNVVQNCSIAFSDGPALTMSGKNNTLDNCMIHDVDWRGVGRSVGVDMGSSDASIVRRCTLFNVGSSEGLVVPRRGPSVVEYNYVHHAGLLQSDGALIQSGGIQLAGTVIRFNWVHDHNAFNWGGNGIRGDDLTRNLLVHHNVAWNCREKGIIVKGDNNRIYNNTCLSNEKIDILAPSRAEPFKPWAPSQHPHLLKQQNANTQIANNCARVITGTFGWQKQAAPPLGRTENNYRDATPGLVDPDAFDFRPRAGSPLVDAGEIVAGITDGFKGKAPDIGAYEHSADRWIPGYRNALWLLKDEKGYLSVRLAMPPVSPFVFEVEGTASDKLSFTDANWNQKRPLRLGQDPIRFRNSALGVDETIDPESIEHPHGHRLTFRTAP